MKYIYYFSKKCFFCIETRYFTIINKNVIYCKCCKSFTDKRYYKTIGNWDWA